MKNKIDKNKKQMERLTFPLEGEDDVYAVYYRSTGELFYNTNFNGKIKIIKIENDVSDAM